MNLSSDTIAVLKNFSDINQNILLKPGNKVQTISTMKNILAEAEISEKFDSEFAIYDLPEFLRSVELFEKPELKFNGGSNVQIADTNSKQSVKYFFADKGIGNASPQVNFVVGDGTNIKLKATDKKNKSSNEYSLNVGETDKKFTAYFKAENFKMVGDDYDVAISKQKISHFVNRNRSIQYWIALEPDSEF